MSKRCIICDKGTVTGKNVSKSKRATPKTFAANLQKIKILKDGHKQRAYVCTRCIKAGKIQKAI
ncbi:MAG: 50S ribosomal protein L28 [Elusimicrobia bacterium]|jgi:large subunit ribosomal protein L28|nr:50S ribosomal protein L28 [Elusimicrobiota bacterium]